MAGGKKRGGAKAALVTKEDFLPSKPETIRIAHGQSLVSAANVVTLPIAQKRKFQKSRSTMPDVKSKKSRGSFES